MRGLGISGEMAKTQTQYTLIILLAMNIPQTTSGKNKNFISKSYASDIQYLALPGISDGREHLHAIMRQRAGSGSWEIIEKVALFLINFIINGQKLKTKGIRNFR